jgi:hypothetical protein
MTAVLLACLVLVTRCGSGPGSARGMVDFISGDVTITRAGKKNPARIGDAITRGIQLATGKNSLAQVRFGAGLLQVYEKSTIDFTSLVLDETGNPRTADIRTEEGAIFSRVTKKLAKTESYRVTSDTMVAAVRGTEFLYAVHGGGGLVACFQGVISVVRAGGTEEIILTAGQMLVVEAGRKMKAVPVPARFRYENFEYGKDPAAGTGTKKESARADSGSAPGDTSGGTGDMRAEHAAQEKTPGAKGKNAPSGKDDAPSGAAVKRTQGGLLDKPRSEIPPVK